MRKFKKNRKIYIKKYDIELDKYLTIEGVKGIVEGALSIDELIERDVFIDLSVLKLCGGISDEKIDKLDYNDLIKDGVINIIHNKIVNYDLIDKYINKYEGTAYIVNAFLSDLLKEIEKGIDKIPDTAKDLETLIKGMNDNGDYRFKSIE